MSSAKLLERFDLVEAARKLPSTYSGGMRRRLDRDGIAVDGVSVRTPDLEDVYFALTGHTDTRKGNLQ